MDGKGKYENYRLRVTKGRTLCQSMKYNPDNYQICFLGNEKMDFGKESYTVSKKGKKLENKDLKIPQKKDENSNNNEKM